MWNIDVMNLRGNFTPSYSACVRRLNCRKSGAHVSNVLAALESYCRVEYMDSTNSGVVSRFTVRLARHACH